MTPEEIVERAAEVLHNVHRAYAVELPCMSCRLQAGNLRTAGLLPTEVEWGVRYTGAALDEAVDSRAVAEDIIATAIRDGRQYTPDHVISRRVTPWTEVTS